MKVLKAGNPFSLWATEFTCKQKNWDHVVCDSKLSFNADDVSYFYRDSREYVFYITCPECKTEIDVTPLLPKEVKDMIRITKTRRRRTKVTIFNASEGVVSNGY